MAARSFFEILGSDVDSVFTSTFELLSVVPLVILDFLSSFVFDFSADFSLSELFFFSEVEDFSSFLSLLPSSDFLESVSKNIL